MNRFSVALLVFLLATLLMLGAGLPDLPAPQQRLLEAVAATGKPLTCHFH
jgi:hypothetical protein